MTDAVEHAAEVEAWRAGRYENLRQDHGWLTLAGLGWLKPGVNRLGSAPDVDVRLPAGPREAGTVTLTADGPVADGAFTRDGRPVEGLRLETDASGQPTLLEVGPLHLCVIERGGRLAIRTWDTESARRRDFHGIDHWRVDPAWRVAARYEPTPGAMLAVPDVIGIVEEQPTPGAVAFEVEGAMHRLQGLKGGPNGELWLVFGDATNGHETYGGGRFLYTSAPDTGGMVVVDFNRAYNPPCVFSPYATCPLPWSANRLPVRIEAGERTDGVH
jgi:uncharacterized protein (DUF1684 family)